MRCLDLRIFVGCFCGFGGRVTVVASVCFVRMFVAWACVLYFSLDGSVVCVLRLCLCRCLCVVELPPAVRTCRCFASCARILCRVGLHVYVFGIVLLLCSFGLFCSLSRCKLCV